MSAYLASPSSVDLSSAAAPNAAGYWVWLRNVGSGEPLSQLPFEVDGTTDTVGWLIAPESYEFCIEAANRSLHSPLSNCERTTIRPSSARSTAAGRAVLAAPTLSQHSSPPGWRSWNHG